MKSFFCLSLLCLLLHVVALGQDSLDEDLPVLEEDSLVCYDDSIGMEYVRDVNDGYYVECLDVDITVHADRTYDIVEHYDVCFVEPHHGVVREIPNRFWVNRDVSEAQDSSRFEMRYNAVKISNIEVSESYSVEDADEVKSLRIGSPDKTVSGQHHYDIRYRLSLPNDRVKASDHFFHSVLGPEWTCSFDSVAFAIHFDKELPDASFDGLRVYVGPVESKDDRAKDVIDSADYHTLTGTLLEMPAGWALTVEMPLPEGYFPTDDIPIYVLLSQIAAVLAFLMLLGLIWLEVQGDEKVAPVVTFQPRRDMTSADVGSLVDGVVDDEDLLSMVPWFAAHGYISIETEGKLTHLRRLKPLPASAPTYQQDLYRAFFPKGDLFTFGDGSSAFGFSWDMAKQSLNEYYARKLDESPYSLYLALTTVMLSLTMCFAQAGPDGWIYGGVINVLLCAYIYVVSMARSFWKEKIHFQGCLSFVSSLYLLVSVGFGLFLGLCMLISAPFTFEDSYIPQSVLTVLMIVMLVVITLKCRLYRMTGYRRERLAEVLGLREFIHTAEKDRLQMLLSRDERYFYKILPYAMAFGMVDEWAAKFKDLEVRTLSEFGGASVGNISSVVNRSRWASNVSSSVSSARSGSGGGSGSARSSRGGYAGGGSGGGGGHSW